ncbi:dickkopf-related protein 3-like [Tachypleus tridentatus]|uniref:dickkopf-related protein 3-like n=1 Tax=Tachypleus tridentatus TaxID=6853 RepID=UPI003FCFC277
MVSRLFIVLFHCSLCLSLTQANIWSFILRNPSPGDSFPSRIHLPWDKKDGKNTKSAEELTRTILVRCLEHDRCPEGMFCDRHYGYCDTLREEDEPCRKDGHCLDILICMFGRCSRPHKKGHKGARCLSDSDCRPKMCCAKQHGERICKEKIPQGHKCYIPDGGLDYSLNELCPCQEGLECRMTTDKKKRVEKLEWRFWTELEHVKCAPGETTLES